MKFVPTKGIAFLIFSAAFCLASLANHAQTAVFTLNSDSPFTVVLEEDTIAQNTQITEISNVPVEILAVTLQQENSTFTTLLFGRLGDTSYYEIDFAAQRLIARVLPPKADSLVQYTYEGRYRNTDTSSVATTEVLANQEEKDLEPVKPRFNIDAAAILAKNKTSEDTVLSVQLNEEPKDSLAEICSENLSNQELKSIRNLLKNTQSITMQLRVVQSALKGKCLYVNQLDALYRYIEEDDIKVSLFKNLYPQILDPQERSILFGQFLFESSIEDIKTYEP